MIFGIFVISLWKIIKKLDNIRLRDKYNGYMFDK